MATRPDSYSSTGEVRAFTRHLLNGSVMFDMDSRPTLTEVERFIDRASGALNVALAGQGLTIPVTNSTAKLLCSDWVTDRAAEMVELTQRGAGFNEGENGRAGFFANLTKRADEFASMNRLGFLRLGVTAAHAKSEGLQSTGQPAPSQRDDPDDTTLAQPKFTMHTFDNPRTVNFGDVITEDDV